MTSKPERSQEPPAPHAQREPREKPASWSARSAGGPAPDRSLFPFSRSPEEDEIREMYGWGV